jgi:TolB protein
MRRLQTVILVAMTLGCLTAAGVTKAEEYDYVDINNPFLRKIPLAVPYFKPISDTPQAAAIAREAADLTAETLAFTGYFKILDRGAFLIDPTKPNIIAPDIKFKNWTTVGADLLITGGVLVQDDLLQLELRLYDTFKESLLVGKRYKGALEDQRRIVRRFCGEIMQLLTGNRGVFDSKVVFVSANGGAKEIYVCDFDGHRPEPLTNHKNISLSPAMSFDGQWVAYTSYVRGKPDLFIKHLRDKQGSVVSKQGTSISPAWLPAENKLSASLSFSGDPEIYLLTVKGKVIKRLTNSRGIDVSPSWSPDGRKFAFVSKRSGSPQIYIMDRANDRAERLTFEGRNNTQPSWSPRGDQIAYCGMVKGRNNIYVIGVDGQGPAQLTRDTGDNESPSWSPDGSLIVFSSTREGPSRLYVMTSFGTDQRRLLSLPGTQSEPSWSANLFSP